MAELDSESQIDYTDSVIDDCIKCNKPLGDKDTYCDTCRIEMDYKTKNINIDDIFALPYSETKRMLINKHTKKIFERYCQLNDRQFVIVNKNKFQMLLNMCRNAERPIEISIILNTTFGVLCVIMAKHADLLLTEIVDSKPNDVKYKYIHAIGPHVLDVWNCTYNYHVFECYYQYAGEFKVCPLIINDIYRCWDLQLGKIRVEQL